MEGNFVNLSNDWIRNGEDESMIYKYGANSLLIYTLLMRNLTYRNTIIFSLNTLSDKLSIKQNNTRIVNKLKESINNINNNLITIYKDDELTVKIDKLEYNKVYYASVKDIPKEKYFKVYDKEINKLLLHIKETNTNKYEISTYLIFLLSCMGNKESEDNYKICYPSIEYSSKICNTTDGNILRYNKILEEARIIAIDNAGMNKNDDGSFKNVSNTYSRYEDKDILNKAVEKHRDSVQIAIDYNTKKLLQNKSRSKAKEISIWKDQHYLYDLSEEEFEELYILERQHYDIRNMINSSKIHINGGYMTLYCTKGGEKKKYSDYEMYTKD